MWKLSVSIRSSLVRFMFSFASGHSAFCELVSHCLTAFSRMAKSVEQHLMYLLPSRFLLLKNVCSGHFLNFNFNMYVMWSVHVFLCMLVCVWMHKCRGYTCKYVHMYIEAWGWCQVSILITFHLIHWGRASPLNTGLLKMPYMASHMLQGFCLCLRF